MEYELNGYQFDWYMDPEDFVYCNIYDIERDLLRTVELIEPRRSTETPTAP